MGILRPFRYRIPKCNTRPHLPAEKHNLISAADRKGKLTTAQRFLSNITFREALGVDASNIEDICRIRKEEEFERAVKAFVEDLSKGDVNSRMNREKIVEYARKFPGRVGLSADKIHPVTITVEPMKKSKRRRGPIKPAKLTHLTYSEKIHEALRTIPSYKLEKIYYSICKLELADYTPLLSVGVWTFIESLTSIAGRNENTDFYSYLSQQRIQSLCDMTKIPAKVARQALKRISEYGNTTKHDSKGAMFNGEQLANDFDLIASIILKLSKEARR